MEKRSHPHVIRTWAVERIRTHAQHGMQKPAPGKTRAPGAKPAPVRRKTS